MRRRRFKGPLGAEMAMPLEVPTQQVQVLQIGAEQHIERIADHRHRAERRIKGDVEQHPADQPARHTELLASPDDVADITTR